MQVIRTVARWLLSLATIVLVLLAIAFVYLQLLLSEVNNYRPFVENLLSESLNSPLTIESMGGQWIHNRPTLVFNKVQLSNDAGKPFVIDELILDIAIVESISARQLILEKIILRGLQLKLLTETNGNITLAGITPSADNSNVPFTHLPSVIAENSIIEWTHQGIQQQYKHTLFIPSALLLNDGNQHKYKVLVSFRERQKSHVQVSGHFELNPQNQQQGFAAEMQIDTTTLDFSTLPASMIPPDIKLRGVASIKTWLSWKNRQLSKARVVAIVSNNSKVILNNKKPLIIPALQAMLSWNQKDKGGKFLLKTLQQSNTIPSNKITGSWLADDGGIRWLLTSGEIKLSEQQLATFKPLFHQQLSLIPKLKPDILLSNARMHLSQSKQGLTDWYFTADGHWRSNDAHQQIPAIRNMNFTLYAKQGKAIVDINSEQLEVNLPRLFRTPLTAKAIGKVTLLQQKNDEYSIHSRLLDLTNHDISTQTRFDISLKPEQSPHIELNSYFSNGLGIEVPTYLPAHIMAKPVVSWLDHAFLDGIIPDGKLLLSGSLDDFPYHKTLNGHFEVSFGTKDLLLHFQDHWPELEQVNANVRFSNNDFSATLKQGLLDKMVVKNVVTTIDSLSPSDAILITGNANAKANDAIRFVSHTPLRNALGKRLALLDVSNRITGGIKIKIPFASDAVKVNGDIRLSNNVLRYKSLDASLNQINGTLKYTESGIYAKNISANLYGQKVWIDIANNKKGTKFTSKLKINQQLFSSVFGQVDIHGQAIANVHFFLPSSGSTKSPRLAVTSHLKGLALNFPAPFYKPANQASAFDLELLFEDNKSLFNISWDKYLTASSQFNSSATLQRAAIHFQGKKLPTLPSAGHISVAGNIDSLSVTKWSSYLSASNTSRLSLIKQTQANVVIADLQTPFGNFQNITPHFNAINTSWRLKVDHPRMAGNVRKTGKGGLSIKLQRLDIQTSDDSGKSNTSNINPFQIPAIDISIKQLSYHSLPLGRFSAQTTAYKNGLKLKKLNLQSDNQQLQGNGQWQLSKGVHNSSLNLTLKTSKKSNLLPLLLDMKNIRSGQGRVSLNLKWEDVPFDFSLDKARGQLEYSLDDGLITDVDPGIARLFGLLNIKSISKRLKLDFKDVTNEGMYFDHSSASFDLFHGIVSNQDFLLQHSGGNVYAKGTIDLNDQSLDYTMTVTPNMGSTVAIAGALAGGPLLGAALLLTQDFIDKPIQNAVAQKFKVSGNWKQPEIVRLKTINLLENTDEDAIH